MISIDGLAVEFGGTTLFSDISFVINEKVLIALMGKNGAGKSTLMNILTGQLTKDGGEVFMEGEPLRLSSPQDALNKNIVLVPQEQNLIPEASVTENIFLGNEFCSKGMIDWKKSHEKAKELLKVLNVDIDVTQPVKKLSAAYQQMVSIAHALTYTP